jgi:hypothetical protein
MLRLMNQNKTTIGRCQGLSTTKCSWHLFCQLFILHFGIYSTTHFFLLDFMNKKQKNYCNDKKIISIVRTSRYSHVHLVLVESVLDPDLL